VYEKTMETKCAVVIENRCIADVVRDELIRDLVAKEVDKTHRSNEHDQLKSK